MWIHTREHCANQQCSEPSTQSSTPAFGGYNGFEGEPPLPSLLDVSPYPSSMSPPSTLFSTLLFAAWAIFGWPVHRAPPPTIRLDNASFVGAVSGNTHKYLGIPFAQPPVGHLRYHLPQPISNYSGTYSVTNFGNACYQQALPVLPHGLPSDALDLFAGRPNMPYAEDCLTLNVWTPSTATPRSRLPVAVWIFGGGFEVGSTSSYDGGNIVERSIDLDLPIVYVSMNYRLSGLGFLASKEVRDAGVGNLGLQDQRQALRWVQKYIGQFGGDPGKVTLWGESAGAISTAMHMVANGGDTEGLFRAAFMESGSPLPVGDITAGQTDYDSLVSHVGCSHSSDTLACLRAVPYNTLCQAIDKSPSIFSYQSLSLAWSPRVDGNFITHNPLDLVASGNVADIPFVTGDCDDEGTLFSFFQTNVTTDSDFRRYVQENYMPRATSAEIDSVSLMYPDDITQGSPFGTGIFNMLTPQFKRLAAFQGDLVFQAPRRFFLQSRAPVQKTWAFLSKRGKLAPFLGSGHATDLTNVYGLGELCDYLISFVATLDPNNAGLGPTWPAWTTARPQVMALLDGLTPRQVQSDTYRERAMNTLMGLLYKYPRQG